MATKRFDKRLHILVSAAEHEMLEELAGRDGLTPSDVVRQLIRQRHAAVFTDAANTTPGTGRARKRAK
jgi:hypothetical protein